MNIASHSPPPDVRKILEQVAEALTTLEAGKLTGTVIIHCATDGYQLEVNSRHKKIAKGAARKGWD